MMHKGFQYSQYQTQPSLTISMPYVRYPCCRQHPAAVPSAFHCQKQLVRADVCSVITFGGPGHSSVVHSFPKQPTNVQVHMFILLTNWDT